MPTSMVTNMVTSMSTATSTTKNTITIETKSSIYNTTRYYWIETDKKNPNEDRLTLAEAVQIGIGCVCIVGLIVFAFYISALRSKRKKVHNLPGSVEKNGEIVLRVTSKSISHVNSRSNGGSRLERPSMRLINNSSSAMSDSKSSDPIGGVNGNSNDQVDVNCNQNGINHIYDDDHDDEMRHDHVMIRHRGSTMPTNGERDVSENDVNYDRDNNNYNANDDKSNNCNYQRRQTHTDHGELDDHDIGSDGEVDNVQLEIELDDNNDVEMQLHSEGKLQVAQELKLPNNLILNQNHPSNMEKQENFGQVLNDANVGSDLLMDDIIHDIKDDQTGNQRRQTQGGP